MQIHYKEVSIMTKYREILRLTALGLKQRDIMKSLGIAQKTVVKIQKRRKEFIPSAGHWTTVTRMTSSNG